MNKAQFLSRLGSSLGDEITAEEKKDLLNGYKNYFSKRMRNGKSEEEAVKNLDDPEKIAKRVKARIMIDRADWNTSKGKLFRAIITICGLSFLKMVFILGPFFGLFVLLLILYAAGISLSFAGIVLFFVGSFLELLYPWVIEIPVQPFISISLSLVIAILGLFWTIAITKLIKWVYKKTVNYLKIHIRTVNYQIE